MLSDYLLETAEKGLLVVYEKAPGVYQTGRPGDPTHKVEHMRFYTDKELTAIHLDGWHVLTCLATPEGYRPTRYASPETDADKHSAQVQPVKHKKPVRALQPAALPEKRLSRIIGV